MTKIVIVAGGLAKRMKPITEEIPKCLIDINGKPLIQHQIEFFRENGYTEIIFCVAHLANKVKDYFRDGAKFGVNITYLEETNKLMGTAGSVKPLEKFIEKDEDFIVYYGDNLTNMDFDKFRLFHKKNKAIATICLRPCLGGYNRSSIIMLNKTSKVKVFLEKPSEEESLRYKDEESYINSGIYLLNKKIFDFIPKDQEYDFAKQVFPSIVEKDLAIFGYVTTEFFREIGRIEKYELFLKEIAGKTKIL